MFVEPPGASQGENYTPLQPVQSDLTLNFVRVHVGRVLVLDDSPCLVYTEDGDAILATRARGVLARTQGHRSGERRGVEGVEGGGAHGVAAQVETETQD